MSTRNSVPTAGGARLAVFPLIPTQGQVQAHADAKASGFTQGHAAGYASGLQMASRETAAARARQDIVHADLMSALEERHASEIAALVLASSALVERTVPVLADAEQALFMCAMDLAEALLGHELRDGETSARAALVRARGQGEAEIPVAIRMNPADVAVLNRDSRDFPASLTLIGDPTLNRGDAVAEYPHGYLDARLGTAVARARAALLGEFMPARTAPDPS